MEPVDILYVAWNRLEFTKATFNSLLDNTNWNLVGSTLIIDDNSTDGTKEWLESKYRFAKHGNLLHTNSRSPVAAMNTMLNVSASPYFFKIDSDLMLPEGWLDVCVDVMDRSPELDLLGVEAWNPQNPDGRQYGWNRTDHIGGIGLMKHAAFSTPMIPNGRGGFTEWQRGREDVIKGWLNPSMPFALLDHMHLEPWKSLSEEYERNGWARYWSKYNDEDKSVWGWVADR